MAASQKVIISCAVTGSVHTPSMSPYLPLTPDEIATDAVAAAEAGAAILHLHARNPEDGSPTPDPDVYMQFLPRIKQQSDAVVNITTGGGLGMTLDERLVGAIVFDKNRVFCCRTHARTLVTFEMWVSGLRSAPAGRNN